jgi:hypothetical protein
MDNPIAVAGGSAKNEVNASEEQIAKLQKVMADFLADTRKLYAEHEQKTRAILKEIDQKKAEAIRNSIQNL